MEETNRRGKTDREVEETKQNPKQKRQTSPNLPMHSFHNVSVVSQLALIPSKRLPQRRIRNKSLPYAKIVSKKNLQFSSQILPVLTHASIRKPSAGNLQSHDEENVYKGVPMLVSEAGAIGRTTSSRSRSTFPINWLHASPSAPASTNTFNVNKDKCSSNYCGRDYHKGSVPMLAPDSTCFRICSRPTSPPCCDVGRSQF